MVSIVTIEVSGPLIELMAELKYYRSEVSVESIESVSRYGS